MCVCVCVCIVIVLNESKGCNLIPLTNTDVHLAGVRLGRSFLYRFNRHFIEKINFLHIFMSFKVSKARILNITTQNLIHLFLWFD